MKKNMNITIYNKGRGALFLKPLSLLFILCSLLFSVALTSCLDTIILPEDKTVDEDFWKTKSDVSSMVNAAYSAMTTEDVMTRLIVWSGIRSDELIKTPSTTGTIADALEEMEAVNMQTTNMFAQWASIYNVINRCNIVLEKAEAVMLEDPNYTRPDFESDRCQMLALRSLCYFYLVRNFRDVPYITEAYMNSSQNTQVPQSAPAYIIDQLIETLEEVVANPNCLRSNSFTVNEWRRVGWFTRDAAMALLADVYLWRASVMHSTADYQKCADYCDLIIESKRQQHVRGRNEVEEKAYPLSDGNQAYRDIFVEQNAEESIFELQSTNNTGLCKRYYKVANNSSTEGGLKASNIFLTALSTQTALVTSSQSVFASQDLRYYGAVYRPKTTSDEYTHVRKMVATTSIAGKMDQLEARTEGRTYDNFNQNYIVYRLTDIMLMKAEAEVQLMRDQAVVPDASLSGNATSDEAVTQWNDSLRQDVYNLVEAVNTRSINQADQSAVGLKWSTYSGFDRQQMESFVMRERLRELCFEGKRWYDLLRYNYRHIDGVQYNSILADLAGDDGAGLPAIYDEMLKLATRSRGSDATAIQAKMQNEAYLYLPVPNSDINVCPLLRQNPAYKESNTYEKTY